MSEDHPLRHTAARRAADHAVECDHADEQAPVEQPAQRAAAPGGGGALPPGSVPSWVALPVGRAETGPSIAELVDAVRAAGGMVGGDALFDPRYEPEMRRFLIRALEMEGIPVPRGGDTP
jgi:hypothetical protein